MSIHLLCGTVESDMQSKVTGGWFVAEDAVEETRHADAASDVGSDTEYWPTSSDQTRLATCAHNGLTA